MIFITGGSGFIGKAVVAELIKKGERVKILVRKSSRVDRLAGDPHVTFFNGDLTSKEDINRGLEGCDRVIHIAGLGKYWARSSKEFHKVNVDGSKAVAEASTEKKIKKICYISSFLALGPSDKSTSNEETLYPRHKWSNEYVRSKYRADLLIKKHIEDGLPAIITYPGFIYGPWEMTSCNIIGRFISDFKKGKTPVITCDMSKILSWVYVDDAASGIVKAFENGAVGKRYILGGENISFAAIFETLSRFLGQKIPKRRVPYQLGKLAALGEEIVGKLTGREPNNPTGAMEIFKHDWAYSSEKAKRELGYSFRSFSKGLTLTMSGIKDNSHINQRPL